MKAIEVSREFKAAPEQIWPLFASPTAILDLIGIEYECGSIDSPNAEHACMITVMEKGKPCSIQVAIVESVPPTRIRTLSTGGFMGGDAIAHNDYLIEIEPTENGSRVTATQNWSPDVPPRGPFAWLVQFLMFRLGRASLIQQQETVFDLIAQHLEQDT